MVWPITWACLSVARPWLWAKLRQVNALRAKWLKAVGNSVWRYYSIAPTGKNANGLIGGK